MKIRYSTGRALAATAVFACVAAVAGGVLRQLEREQAREAEFWAEMARWRREHPQAPAFINRCGLGISIARQLDAPASAIAP